MHKFFLIKEIYKLINKVINMFSFVVYDFTVFLQNSLNQFSNTTSRTDSKSPNCNFFFYIDSYVILNGYTKPNLKNNVHKS